MKVKNTWIIPLFVVAALSLMAPQEPFVFKAAEPCRVGYRDLSLAMLMPPDSVKRYLPKMAIWYPSGQGEMYDDTVFVRFRDVSQDLIDVPGYGQALPELYLEFSKNKLSYFKAVYKMALDNFRAETVDRVLKSLAASHTQLKDSVMRKTIFAKPFVRRPQPGCEERMTADTAAAMFQLMFTYEMIWKDSL